MVIGPCFLQIWSEAGFKRSYVPPAKPRKGSGDEPSRAVSLFEIRIEITVFDFLVETLHDSHKSKRSLSFW